MKRRLKDLKAGEISRLVHEKEIGELTERELFIVLGMKYPFQRVDVLRKWVKERLNKYRKTTKKKMLWWSM